MVGTFYAITRNLWPVIVMHATFDIVMVLTVYFGLQAAIAHLVFH
jgi:hypothetical protein